MIFYDELEGVEPSIMYEDMGVNEEVIWALIPAVGSALLTVMREIVFNEL
jgi:hypothetical protein